MIGGRTTKMLGNGNQICRGGITNKRGQVRVCDIGRHTLNVFASRPYGTIAQSFCSKLLSVNQNV
jgi:hypothetical protein